jgi:hypothetical protein
VATKKPRTPTPPRPVQVPKRREDPRRRPTVDRRLLLGGIGALVVAAVVIVLAVVLTGGDGSSSSTAKIDWATIPHLQQGPPPWPNDSDNLPDRLQPLGLSQLSAEGEVLHVHQHLDLWVDGKKVTLPAGVGIYAQSWLTELHTHDSAGIIHVESPSTKDFHLGQVFGEWGVKLTPRCVGTECGKLSWWVNGKRQAGDPAGLVLKDHQEIAIVLGKAPKTVPKSYDFSARGL